MNKPILPHEIKGRKFDFNCINAEHRAYINVIAVRAVAWARDYKKRNRCDDLLDPDSVLFEMDICVCHYYRNLDLHAWLHSDDFIFIQEFVIIEKNIQRPLAFFPVDVSLRFASIGASHRIIAPF